jgi:hypothetical protein
MIRKTLAAACGLMLMATASHAATIDIQKIRKPAAANLITDSILINGAIELDDDVKLRAILEADPGIAGNRNVIVFNSPGGHVLPGIRMGAMIKLRGLATWVSNGDLCASVCAAMWLAGSTRYAAGTARIGFHSAFLGALGQPVTNERSAPGNAVMQAYYSKIGIKPETATFLVTVADPTDMFWLNDMTAKQLGIAWQLLNAVPERTPCLASFRPSTCF